MSNLSSFVRDDVPFEDEFAFETPRQNILCISTMAEPSLFAAGLRRVARGGSFKSTRYFLPDRDAELLAVIGADVNDTYEPRTVFDRAKVGQAMMLEVCRNVSDTLPLLALALSIPHAAQRVPGDVRATLMPCIKKEWHMQWLADKNAVQKLLNGAVEAGDACAHARAVLTKRFPTHSLWCAAPNASLLHVLADCVRLRAGSDMVLFIMLCPGFEQAWEALLESSCRVLEDQQADVIAMATAAPPPPSSCTAQLVTELVQSAMQTVPAPHRAPAPIVTIGERAKIYFDDKEGRIQHATLPRKLKQHEPRAPVPAMVAARLRLEWARARVRMHAVRFQHEVPDNAGFVMLEHIEPEARAPLLRNLLHRPHVLHDSPLSYMNGGVAYISRALAHTGTPLQWAELAIALNRGAPYTASDDSAAALQPIMSPPVLPTPAPALLPCPICQRAGFKSKGKRARHIGMCKKKQRRGLAKQARASKHNKRTTAAPAAQT